MARKRVLVISSANIDFVQNMARVPYAGETVSEPERGYEYVPGGKGANSAIAFARFGADCVFCCKLGKDQHGKRLMSMYKNEGIDTRYIIEDEKLPTGFASILVEANGKNRIIVYPGANGTLTKDDVEEAFGCMPDAVYLQFEIPDEAVIEASRLCTENGIPLFIDAGPARIDYPLDRIGPVEIFSPNENEIRTLTGITPSSEQSCLRAAIKLRSFVNAKNIVIKLGDRGAFVYDGSQYFVIPAEKVKAVDTTAAGDIFTAVMTYVYMNNGNIVSAVKYATCAAAISVTRKGASTSVPTKDEVIAFAKKKVKEEASSHGFDCYDAYNGVED